MGNKKVSVVVATYNQEKYIGHTLESIVSQKVNFEYEVIVGDDCSTDGNAAVIKEYAEKYPDIIVPILREKNLGMGGNVADLTMRTTGEYVAFIEGDDFWIDENKLQKQVDFLDSHPDYVACFGLCQIVDKNEVRQENLEQWSGFMKEGGEYTLKMFQDYVLPGQTATSMYRKVAYGQLQQKIMASGIDPRKLIDRSQVLCMMAVGKMYNLGEFVSAYRYVLDENSGSWSSQNDFYSKENVLNYLQGMKDMEKIAEALELNLNFDERRLFELNKLEDNRNNFEKKDYNEIFEKILEDSYDKQQVKSIHNKRQLKRTVKKLVGKK
ncbi:Glycosyl transferase family 2 [Pseudobutyrivibrio sp. YE44]|uniref:glycosyltransferase family 2 protein n=1 Tax=Pseudobutyrivibrio sp. YE44 TaxID=1520802 RepID=UPI00088F59A4|nr:glycosyltransferase family 2 protein [Pseudobutyrivibrio sp. YE44]SDB46545.1 Glycosyl transferase family 2 [Pseudobutyrivibrio sp. YE44]